MVTLMKEQKVNSSIRSTQQDHSMFKADDWGVRRRPKMEDNTTKGGESADLCNCSTTNIIQPLSGEQRQGLIWTQYWFDNELKTMGWWLSKRTRGKGHSDQGDEVEWVRERTGFILIML